MAVMDTLKQMPGVRVIDVDEWAYKHKKGRDIIIEAQGQRASIEMKYDKLSEKTGNVAIDLDSLRKTESSIWLFGLPRGNEIDIYSMKLSELVPFALGWPIRRDVGEFHQPVALVPKSTFLSQPFVYKFKTIELQ